MSSRQALTEALVKLTDIPAEEASPCTVLPATADRAVELLNVDAAAIVRGSHDGPALAAATAQPAGAVTQTELQLREGPAVDSLASGQPHHCDDLGGESSWPRFTAAAVGLGYVAVSAVPIRYQADTLGALELLRARPGQLGDEELAAAQALGSLAASRIAHHQDVGDRDRKVGQLQTALDSRVIIEQAKGTIAACRDVDIDQAFSWMRRHARNHNRKLHEVAQEVMNDPQGHELCRRVRLQEANPEVHQAVGMLSARNNITIEQAWTQLRDQAESNAIPITTLAQAVVQHGRRTQ